EIEVKKHQAKTPLDSIGRRAYSLAHPFEFALGHGLFVISSLRGFAMRVANNARRSSGTLLCRAFLTSPPKLTARPLIPFSSYRYQNAICKRRGQEIYFVNCLTRM